MSKKQTAVEWLVSHWEKLQSEGEKMSWNQIIQITELAKAMEKEQIVDAYNQGESDAYKQFIINIDKKYESFDQYYNDTYGK